jgi:tetratricopeptide (TPR) repeat protein
MRLWVAAVALGLLAGAPAAARAQSDPRLMAALRAAQEGQGDSARASIQRLLDATSPTDSLYPQILYTQAMVADNAGDMRRALQRVIVEYPTSDWGDDALVRLVQMDYATRSYDAAARNLERLRQDFPLTPLYAQAAYWAGRTYFDLKNPGRACEWLADGMARVGDNLELQNQLGYLYQRCGVKIVSDSSGSDSSRASGDTTHTADSTRADTTGRRESTRAGDSARTQSPTRGPDSSRTASRPPARARADSGAAARPALARFRVQVAAVATPGAADDAADAAEKLGYPAVIVRERGLYKVRAGAFPTREAAQAAAGRIKARVGGNPFVVAIP